MLPDAAKLTNVLSIFRKVASFILPNNTFVVIADQHLLSVRQELTEVASAPALQLKRLFVFVRRYKRVEICIVKR